MRLFQNCICIPPLAGLLLVSWALEDLFKIRTELLDKPIDWLAGKVI